jgi:transcription initiation factor TFIID subunit 12
MKPAGASSNPSSSSSTTTTSSSSSIPHPQQPPYLTSQPTPSQPLRLISPQQPQTQTIAQPQTTSLKAAATVPATSVAPSTFQPQIQMHALPPPQPQPPPPQQPQPEDNEIISRRKLHELVAQLSPHEKLDTEVEDVCKMHMILLSFTSLMVNLFVSDIARICGWIY